MRTNKITMKSMGSRNNIFYLDSRMLLGLVVFSLISALPSTNSLTGEHVCSRVGNFTTTFKETYTEPVIVQTFTWCLQVPPRCPKTRVENRLRYRLKTKIEQRSISECCEGYVLQELNGDIETTPRCIPFCEDCRNGLCLSPNTCQCRPGYQGDNCAHQCPPGSWGEQCTQQCECSSESTCNPTNGDCECPAGWEGPRCDFPCPNGRWGFRCALTCECPDTTSGCDPETGSCRVTREPDRIIFSNNWTTEDLFQPIQTTGTRSPEVESTHNPATSTGVTDIVLTWFQAGTTRDDRYSPNTGSTGLGTRLYPRTTENVEASEQLEIFHRSDYETEEQDCHHQSCYYVTPVYFTSMGEGSSASDEKMDFSGSMTSDFRVEVKRPLSTQSSVTVVDGVSQKSPSPGNNLTGKFRVDSAGSTQMKLKNDAERTTPRASYVKTIQKGEDAKAPFDMTIFIVLGSIVALCLTSFAVLVIFYMRVKLFESISMALNRNDGKPDGNPESGLGETKSKLSDTSLPDLPTFANPVFTATNQDTALITFDNPELNKHYANRTATISIRVSGNIRELLESHYDRPPAATCCHAPIDSNTEHVYDEIPLTIPLCLRKDT